MQFWGRTPDEMKGKWRENKAFCWNLVALWQSNVDSGWRESVRDNGGLERMCWLANCLSRTALVWKIGIRDWVHRLRWFWWHFEGESVANNRVGWRVGIEVVIEFVGTFLLKFDAVRMEKNSEFGSNDGNRLIFGKNWVDLLRMVGRNVLIGLLGESCGIRCTISSMLAVDGVGLKELKKNINLNWIIALNKLKLSQRKKILIWFWGVWDFI